MVRLQKGVTSISHGRQHIVGGCCHLAKSSYLRGQLHCLEMLRLSWFEVKDNDVQYMAILPS